MGNPFSAQDYRPNAFTPDWSTVQLFENKIAEFFGAPYAVAVDSCTHGIELCLRYLEAKYMHCPTRTYVSVPMLAKKLNIDLGWENYEWKNTYCVHDRVYDAAVLWERDSYKYNSFMSISFQYQKHLSLGRGGMILCPTLEAYQQLKKMSYDGRLPGIPWREQDIDTMGYHYYMQPELAQLGLSKLPAAVVTESRIWSVNDWPDVSKMKIFNK